TTMMKQVFMTMIDSRRIIFASDLLDMNNDPNLGMILKRELFLRDLLNDLGDFMEKVDRNIFKKVLDADDVPAENFKLFERDQIVTVKPELERLLSYLQPSEGKQLK